MSDSKLWFDFCRLMTALERYSAALGAYAWAPTPDTRDERCEAQRELESAYAAIELGA